jgi:hypothetical protein
MNMIVRAAICNEDGSSRYDLDSIKLICMFGSEIILLIAILLSGNVYYRRKSNKNE